MPELKPCPFCGGEAKVENNDRKIYDPHTLGFVDVEYGDPPCVWVKCEECEAFVGGFDTEEQAIAAWNRRADGWIPVSERLPDVPVWSETYNVVVEGCNKRVMAMEWSKAKIRGKDVCRWKWHDRISPWKVTHWQPLPAEPETERSDG